MKQHVNLEDIKGLDTAIFVPLIKNGYIKHEGLFRTNAFVKKLTIGKMIEILEDFIDVNKWEDLSFGTRKPQGDKYVIIDKKYYRPLDVSDLCGDITKARRILKWEPKVKFDKLCHKMMDYEMENIK